MKTGIYSEFVGRATEHLVEALGGALIHVVQLGSLAHGGFSERFSDIDIAVILKDRVTAARIEDLKQRLAGLEPLRLAEKISLFWTVPDFSWGRLRPVDQVDLHDNGRPLWGGPLRGLAPRPAPEAVREDMRALSLPYWAEKTRHFSGQLPASESEFKEFVRCLLYPARLIFTWRTGRLGSNDEAVDYAERVAADSSLRPDMLREALGCRNGEIEDRHLFRFQPDLERQRFATLAFLGLDTATPSPSAGENTP